MYRRVQPGTSTGNIKGFYKKKAMKFKQNIKGKLDLENGTYLNKVTNVIKSKYTEKV